MKSVEYYSNQLNTFVKEYKKLCKKHGCFIGTLCYDVLVVRSNEQALDNHWATEEDVVAVNEYYLKSLNDCIEKRF